MVLTTRELSSVVIHPTTYSQPAHSLLETIEGDQLVGLLRQIAQLSDHAAEIFSGLYADATATFQRVASLSSRLSSLSSLTPSLVAILEAHPADVFYSQSSAPSFVRPPDGHPPLFTPDSIPVSVARARAAVPSPPNLSILDSFTGRRCAKEYSDPQFFLDRWLSEEKEKMARAMEENKARKEKRRKRRKEDRQTGPKTVAAVTVKTFSALGKEFDVAAPAAVQRQPSLPRPPSTAMPQATAASPSAAASDERRLSGSAGAEAVDAEEGEEEGVGMSLASFRPIAALTAAPKATTAASSPPPPPVRRQPSMDLGSAAAAAVNGSGPPPSAAVDSAAAGAGVGGAVMFHEDDEGLAAVGGPSPVAVPSPPSPSPRPSHGRQPSGSAAPPPPPPPRVSGGGAAPPPPPPSHLRQPSLSPPSLGAAVTSSPPPSAPALSTPPRGGVPPPPPPPPRPSSPMAAQPQSGPPPPPRPSLSPSSVQQQQLIPPPPPPPSAVPPSPPRAPAFTAEVLAAPPAAPPMAPPMSPPMAPPVAPVFAPPMAPAMDGGETPAAPPMFDSIPPPPPPPSFSAPSAGGRDGLLDAIKAGGRLKKVEVGSGAAAGAAVADGGAKGGLLGEIKNRNFQLRAVDKAAVEEKRAAQAAPTSGLSSIMDVLARRTAIVGNDSDSDDNDEWDED